MVTRKHILDALTKDIIELKKEISNRGSDFSAIEAAVFYDHAVSLSDQFAQHRFVIEDEDLDLDSDSDSDSDSDEILSYTQAYLQLIVLKAKLKRISESGTDPTRGKSLCKSMLKIHENLKNQIESMERASDPNPVESEVLYNHLTQIYERFISNQNQLEKLAEGHDLGNAMEIFTETQAKVIALQIRYKQIIASAAVPTPQIASSQQNPPESDVNRLLTPSESDLNRLLIIQNSLGNEIRSLEANVLLASKPEEAKILRISLTNLNRRFSANLDKIKMGDLLEIQLARACDIHEKIRRMEIKIHNVPNKFDVYKCITSEKFVIPFCVASASIIYVTGMIYLISRIAYV